MTYCSVFGSNLLDLCYYRDRRREFFWELHHRCANDCAMPYHWNWFETTTRWNWSSL